MFIFIASQASISAEHCCIQWMYIWCVGYVRGAVNAQLRIADSVYTYLCPSLTVYDKVGKEQKRGRRISTKCTAVMNTSELKKSAKVRAEFMTLLELAFLYASSAYLIFNQEPRQLAMGQIRWWSKWGLMRVAASSKRHSRTTKSE